jgi:hypothetical protein
MKISLTYVFLLEINVIDSGQVRYVMAKVIMMIWDPPVGGH